MHIKIIAFTQSGLNLANRLATLLGEEGHDAELSNGRKQATSLQEWVQQGFDNKTPLVFIGATGIAVRSIAPYLRSKISDPAVLVIDTAGRYVIPLLSGHVGGANALAKHLAHILGATAILTTATDVHKVFAVDTWATEQNLVIFNPERIKHISSSLLEGREIRFSSPYSWTGDLPQGLVHETANGDIKIGYSISIASEALHLVPRILTLGVGCRKGTSAESIETAVKAFLTQEEINPLALQQVCSIDLKQNEPGLVQFCEKQNLLLRTFTSAQLGEVTGDFSGSAFVHSVTGVDNVCERSAVLGSGGTLVVRKTIINSITLALAESPLLLTFPKKEVYYA